MVEYGTMVEIGGSGSIKYVSVPPTDTSTWITRTACRIVGYSLHETTGSTWLQIVLYDGGSTAGELVLIENISQGLTVTRYLCDIGLPVRTGLYMQVVNSTVQGVLWLLM